MSTTEALAPVKKTIKVEASIEAAFDTFTSRIGDWWPASTHTIFGDTVEAVVFDEHVGGRVYERAKDGEEADWADVMVWEPPRRLVLRWRVNLERGPTEVEVRFTPEDGETRIDLEHRGWDRIADEAGRADYDPGWDFVLGCYVDWFQGE